MRQLNYATVEYFRHMPGLSALLFITDRCPVGCAHCSVDSLADSPTITDFDLFQSLVETLATQASLALVGISGGEPFVERRGLCLAVDRLAKAGKYIIIYTSGIWAKSTVPAWIRQVLRSTATVFLSTDAFHAAAIKDEQYVRAARIICDEGAWIIVQVLEAEEMVSKAENLLHAAFGQNYEDFAEIHPIPMLPYGRGVSIFSPRPYFLGAKFGACKALASPVVRYDGVVTPCCNERTIMGQGPARLRRHATTSEEVAEAFAEFRNDHLLSVIGGIGAGALTHHPRFTDLAEREFSTICELCWVAQERAHPLGDQSDRLLAAMTMLK